MNTWYFSLFEKIKTQIISSKAPAKLLWNEIHFQLFHLKPFLGHKEFVF